ncbi:hypothetical protein [Polyangium sp. 6x1]|uniref:hypothetical protein n=1 Tax=Polyangium sp. 6x1 TaxID=3042689 RepID=UPI002482877D|nr:hypothetical protein [Polyangium sp. 6x1]MDI1445781.1 hypothetical protein [Polyangium sp. 6x1]
MDPEAIRAAAEEARFREHARRGHRAKAAGKLVDALDAYADALAIRPDPLIAGRLGVVLVALNSPAEAADLLHDAVNRDWSADERESRQFSEAYRVARAAVCMVDVQISHMPDTTTLDGKRINGKRHSAFFTFVMPGEHEIRATLTGYRDGRAVFTACKGGSMDVPVTLTPLPPDPPIEPIPAPTAPPEPAAIPRPPGLPEVRLETLGDPRLGIAGAVAVVDGKPLPKQEDPYAYDDPPESGGKKSGVRGSIGVGPAMVIGVASWQPAIGATIAAHLQPAGFFSIGIDARAAWLPSGVGDRPIRAMTAGGLVSLCGHWRWLFGCAVGHLGVLKVDFDKGPYLGASFVGFRPGFGGRVGGIIRVGGPFSVRVAGDALGLSHGTRIGVNDQIIVEQPAVMIAGTTMIDWSF